MRKVGIKRTLILAVLVLTMTVGMGSGLASAKTKTLSNGVKVEYGTTWFGAGNVWARSYLKDGYICPHWASVYVRETGKYAAKDTPYRGWTWKASVNPSTWRTYHWTASAGKGYK